MSVENGKMRSKFEEQDLLFRQLAKARGDLESKLTEILKKQQKTEKDLLEQESLRMNLDDQLQKLGEENQHYREKEADLWKEFKACQAVQVQLFENQ